MRRLAIASFSFACALVLCHYVIPKTLHMWMIGIVAVIALCGLLLRGKKRTYILLVCVFLILGICRYDIQSKRFLGIEEPLIGNQYRITAYASEFPVIYEDYSKITVHLRTDLLPKVKMVLYDYSHAVDEMKPGDMLRATVKFSSATVSYGEETDTYISKGIYLRGTIQDEVKIYETSFGRFLFAPRYLASEIQGIFDRYIPQRAAVFMKALVTGEKIPLYEMPEIDRIIREAGLSHVVAVSGMHISFLVGMLMMLFGNRFGWIASIVSMGVFAVMTGLSPSVLRASFMQVLYLLAPVVRRESDGMTSIAFALFVLLMVNPFSVASVSLQLSFAAVLGIVMFTERLLQWFAGRCERLNGVVRRGYYYVISSLSMTLGASVFTIPLCAIHFGSISLLAPITNLLVLWIVPFCFALGFVLCIVSLLSVRTAALIGGIISLMVEYIYCIAELISSVSYANLHLPMNIMLFWIVFSSVMIGIILLIIRRGALRPFFAVFFPFIFLILLAIGVNRYYRSGTVVAAIDVGQGQCIAILNEEETILIDCGGMYGSDEAVAAWLKARGRSRIDCLILTHFDKDHVNGVAGLMNHHDVDEIRFCSLNLSDKEKDMLFEIQAAAEKNNTAFTVANHTQTIDYGGIELIIYVPKQTSGNNGLLVLATVDGFDLLVTGDADMETESEFIRFVPLPDGECIIAGHHGSKHSTGEALLDRFKPEFSFISCGHNQYGHPTQEVLDRLEQRNVVIYRTDQLGSIEIKVR